MANSVSPYRDPPGETISMRIPDPEAIQINRPPHASERALWLAGRVCGWLGEAFIGFSWIALSWAGRYEKERNPAQRKERTLLPVHRCRNVAEVTRCPNCFREIKELIETIRIEHGMTFKTVQCEECTEIHTRQLERLEKAKWN